MALQFSTTVRNALLDQIETSIGVSAVIKFFTGGVPANCAAADSGTKLAEFDLASDWAAAASAGAKALSSLPLSVAAVAAGTLGYFRIYATGGTTCHMQGTITATGGGGDMELDNVSLAATQSFTISSFAVTDGNA